MTSCTSRHHRSRRPLLVPRRRPSETRPLEAAVSRVARTPLACRVYINGSDRQVDPGSLLVLLSARTHLLVPPLVLRLRPTLYLVPATRAGPSWRGSHQDQSGGNDSTPLAFGMASTQSSSRMMATVRPKSAASLPERKPAKPRFDPLQARRARRVRRDSSTVQRYSRPRISKEPATWQRVECSRVRARTGMAAVFFWLEVVAPEVAVRRTVAEDVVHGGEPFDSLFHAACTNGSLLNRPTTRLAPPTSLARRCRHTAGARGNPSTTAARPVPAQAGEQASRGARQGPYKPFKKWGHPMMKTWLLTRAPVTVPDYVRRRPVDFPRIYRGRRAALRLQPITQSHQLRRRRSARRTRRAPDNEILGNRIAELAASGIPGSRPTWENRCWS